LVEVVACNSYKKGAVIVSYSINTSLIKETPQSFIYAHHDVGLINGRTISVHDEEIYFAEIFKKKV
jgi:hypothetical protein